MSGNMKNEGISRKQNQLFRDRREEQGPYYDMIKIICDFSETQAENSHDTGKARILHN
jgi:hypothetical protein